MAPLDKMDPRRAKSAPGAIELNRHFGAETDLLNLQCDLYDAGAVLQQLSYQANWELVVMWVDCKPVDDGYRSLSMMSIHESHGFQLRRHRRGQGSNPAQARISQAILVTTKVAFKKKKIAHFKLCFNPHFKYMTFTYQNT